MRLRTLLLVSTTLLLAVTCDKKKEEPEPQPQPPVTPKIEIPSESQAVFSQGISIQAGTQAQSQTVKFTATAAWSANVADTKAPSWLSVQPDGGGAGSVTMTVTAQPNTTDKARSATVTIQCGTVKQSFTVKQDAAAPQTVAVESVTLNKTELTLEPSGTETLTATVAPENATDKTVTWNTSNAEIATVADGKVTAVKEGEAIITAKAGEKQATCKVTVKKATVAVESVTLNKTELTLEPDGTETLIATIKPDNATDKTVTWSTSNAEIANVADGKVTAVKEGEAIITAKAGEKQATCKVTVKKGVVAVTSVTLNRDKLDLKKGEDETLVATVAPDDATDKTVTWSSSDATIASVDQTGKVTAVKSGKATITAAAGEKSATCSVTVTTPVQSVSLDRTSVTLEVGQMTTLFATVSPNDADEKTVTWTSSNVAVASIAGGVVTAMSEGTAVIKASVGGKEASCTVTVQKAVVAVTSVTMNKSTLSLTKDQSETLTVTVAPENATDKTVTWSSSDATIASVDQTGKVTAVKSGKATITAAAGEKSATCKVTVTTPVQSVSLDRTSVSLEEGQTTTLTATISPNDADEQTVTWSTSNAAAASVANGVVTAVAEGTAVIKASVGGKEASCTVTVKRSVVAVTSVTLNKTTLPLTKGQSETLTATVAPDNATDKTVTWSSSDATIASVDQTGKVTAVKSGKATITAAAGEKSASCEVTVTTPVQSVSLDRTSVSLLEGQNTTLTAAISPNDADEQTVFWTSSNQNVATVSNGVISAANEGTAVITARAGDKSAECEVSVIAANISTAPASVTFLSSGGNKEVKVSCNGDWTLTGLPSWCVASANSGSGDATLTLSAVANGGKQRTATLMLSCLGKTASITVNQVAGGWQNQQFVHKSLYMMFTSVWCSYSDGMNQKIRKADSKVGGKYVRVNLFSKDLGESSLDYPEESSFMSYYASGIPSGILDYRKLVSNWDNSNNWFVTQFSSAILEQEECYPPVTGVAFRSSMTGQKLHVEGDVYSHKAGTFKLTVFLLEDLAVVNEKAFDNILRKTLTDTSGDVMVIEQDNSIKSFEYSITIPEGYNQDNLSLVVVVSRQYGSQTVIADVNVDGYYIDNCRKASVGMDAKLEVYDSVSGGIGEGYDEGDEITF